MFCTNCGQKFEGNFCPNCGTPVFGSKELGKNIRAETKDGHSSMTVLEAVKKSGTGTALWKGSIKAAQDMLLPSESVIHAFTANVATYPVSGPLNTKPMKIKGKISGVVVITSKRILFCNSVLGSGTSKEIQVKQIQSIDDTNSMVGSSCLRVSGITEMFVIEGRSTLLLEAKKAIYTAMQQ